MVVQAVAHSQAVVGQAGRLPAAWPSLVTVPAQLARSAVASVHSAWRWAVDQDLIPVDPIGMAPRSPAVAADVERMVVAGTGGPTPVPILVHLEIAARYAEMGKDDEAKAGPAGKVIANADSAGVPVRAAPVERAARAADAPAIVPLVDAELAFGDGVPLSAVAPAAAGAATVPPVRTTWRRSYLPVASPFAVDPGPAARAAVGPELAPEPPPAPEPGHAPGLVLAPGPVAAAAAEPTPAPLPALVLAPEHGPALALALGPVLVLELAHVLELGPAHAPAPEPEHTAGLASDTAARPAEAARTPSSVGAPADAEHAADAVVGGVPFVEHVHAALEHGLGRAPEHEHVAGAGDDADANADAAAQRRARRAVASERRGRERGRAAAAVVVVVREAADAVDAGLVVNGVGWAERVIRPWPVGYQLTAPRPSFAFPRPPFRC